MKLLLLLALFGAFSFKREVEVVEIIQVEPAELPLGFPKGEVPKKLKEPLPPVKE
ncbi:hypothetical protein N9A94_05975 [Akkermansiaceae bacterium]|nr:hypothetical protein [Akkermansiaceae bacterium]